MTRVIAFVVVAIGLAACASCQKVPEHTHLDAEIGLSCEETCAPGTCDSSYDISAQKEIPCEQEAEQHALCICRAP